jgi:hypothetical protein
MSEKFVLFDSRMGDKANWGDFFLKPLLHHCVRGQLGEDSFLVMCLDLSMICGLWL